MTSNKEYYAFISYKREDEKWAKWLQHKLEHYRLPVNVRKENAALPQTIRPIFKDTSELAAGVLADEIHEALENSKYLIVICSPRAAQSEWVGKEVQAFIDMGRSDKIIPFIIGGTPFSQNPEEECFPAALLNLPKEQELLGVNINEMGRDAAAVKVVSCMFGLNFDTLWQRYEREQKKHRWMLVGGALLFALISFAVGGYFVRQNGIIESQKEQLQNFISHLEEEKITQSQLQDDLKRYVFSGSLRGNDCDDIPMIIAYHPYEPLVSFTDDLGYWLHYLNSNVEIMLPTDGDESAVRDVSTLCFSSDGTKLMAECPVGVYVWNVERCELIKHYKLSDNYWKSQEFQNDFPNYMGKKDQAKQILFFHRIRYWHKNGYLNIYDLYTKMKVSTNMELDEGSTLNTIYNLNYNEILFATNKRAALYDVSKGCFVLFFKGYNDGYAFSESGEYLEIGKDIYTRTVKIDTIQQKKYTRRPIDNCPQLPKEKDSRYDMKTHASLDVLDNSILYKCGKQVKKTDVIKIYTMGNGQGCLQDALFAGSNRVAAIVHQGKIRIYNTNTWILMGSLFNYVNDLYQDYHLGHEMDLCHADTYIEKVKYINRKLYVISSGGIIRIYNVDKYRLETVIELPFERNDENRWNPIEVIYFADDASILYYSVKDEPYYYRCELPEII